MNIFEYAKMKKVLGGSGGSGGGGAALNIAYGDTAPEDTSKLWVKTAKPSAVKVSSELSIETADNTSITRLDALSVGTTYAPESEAQVGTKLYIFGGYYSKLYYHNKIICFDTESQTAVHLTATLPVKLSYPACAAIGDIIYIFGGVNNGDFTKAETKIYRLDTKTETLTTLSTELPYQLQGIPAFTHGDAIYLFGGNAGNSTQYNTILKFDSKTETIETLNATLDTARTKLFGAKVGEDIYLFGGYPAGTSVLKFNCASETLIATPVTIPATMSGVQNSACAVIEDTIYIFGGTKTGSGTKNIHTFNPATQNIELLPTALPFAMSDANLAVRDDNSVYLISGSALCLFVTGMAIVLNEDILQIQLGLNKNIFKLVNTDKAQVEIRVDKVYKGNADGIGEEVKASLHNGTSWVEI